jgi:predicted TPR repeat methyltransferase
MLYNQNSLATEYNRYPEIFKEVSYIIPSPKQILSFGCSTGMECNTLHELYYLDTKIIGLDINTEVIKKNNYKNNYKNIEYVNNIKEITEKSDLIFAMSVLCRWPESE